MSEIDQNFEILFNFHDTYDKPSFVKIAIRGILTECFDQLLILRQICGQNAISFTEDIIQYKSLQDRYIGLEDHGEHRLNLKSSNYDKLSLDINMIMNVLREAREEISVFGTTLTIESSIETLRRMQDDDVRLMEDIVENEKYIETLRNKCEEERLCNIRTIEETNDKIQKLRFEVEDVSIYGKYEVTFFENWEKARREQNSMACNYRENDYQSVIDDMTNKIKLETRCHNELENYLEESTEDYKEEINYWMKKYDEEVELREEQMINLKMDVEKLNNEFDTMNELYRSRQAEIEDWLLYKKKKKEKEEQEQLELWAAIKIQAWWRGVMFRKKLGPYRKKKKKKGKGKDKKGGKKKNS